MIPQIAFSFELLACRGEYYKETLDSIGSVEISMLESRYGMISDMIKKASRYQTVDVQTKYGLFAVSFERDGKGYAASVPRISEIATFGTTLADAKRMAREAIEVAIEGEVLARAEQKGTIKFSRNARKVFA